MTSNPTLGLAEFAAGAAADTLPPAVETRARELLLDYLGVSIAGRALPSSVRAAEYAAASGSGEASVCLRWRASAPLAALANGMAAHALELDDVTNVSSLHPGVVVWPAAMAALERRGGALGELLAAGVAGYEVTMRVGDALNAPAAYARGFHPTGVAGALGAAAAAASAGGATAAQTLTAMGLAGSMASGSMAYVQNGSDGKRLNAGWAAHSGLIAADLAAAGVTGPPDVLTGTYGLLRAYSNEPRPQALAAVDRAAPALLDAAIKPYPCCRYIHPVIDACLRLRESEDFCADRLRTVTVSVLPGGGEIIAEPPERKLRPETRVDAQFSVYFAAAVTLIHGAPALASFDAPYLHDAAVGRLAARVQVMQDAELDARYPERWGCRLRAAFVDGGERRVLVKDPSGDPRRPLRAAELEAKFRSLADPVDPELAARTLSWALRAPLHEPVEALTRAAAPA